MVDAAMAATDTLHLDEPMTFLDLAHQLDVLELVARRTGSAAVRS